MSLKKCLVCLVPVFVAASATAHPHFPKKIAFDWKRGGEDSMTVSHVTVPYNEILAGDFKVGDSWHCGRAEFTTTSDLKNGGTAVAAGTYSINVTKDSEDDWSLHLVTGKDADEKSTDLSATLTKDLPMEEHLRFDIQPHGAKGDETHVDLVLRFGPYRMTATLSQ